ncbi:hypothetical protein VKT23_013673 [Stygiomarasmius scandens]|uniref:Uncharacterized protein n=1 Tax=Marasmiellus scandens TaxID=2682957 RepID=A0ABR1J4P7_9AGAR
MYTHSRPFRRIITYSRKLRRLGPSPISDDSGQDSDCFLQPTQDSDCFLQPTISGDAGHSSEENQSKESESAELEENELGELEENELGELEENELEEMEENESEEMEENESEEMEEDESEELEDNESGNDVSNVQDEHRNQLIKALSCPICLRLSTPPCM